MYKEVIQCLCDSLVNRNEIFKKGHEMKYTLRSIILLFTVLCWTSLSYAGNKLHNEGPLTISTAIVEAGLIGRAPQKMNKCSECHSKAACAICGGIHYSEVKDSQLKQKNLHHSGGKEIGKTDVYLLTKFTHGDEDIPFRKSQNVNGILPTIPKFMVSSTLRNKRGRSTILLL